MIERKEQGSFEVFTKLLLSDSTLELDKISSIFRRSKGSGFTNSTFPNSWCVLKAVVRAIIFWAKSIQTTNTDILILNSLSNSVHILNPCEPRWNYVQMEIKMLISWIFHTKSTDTKQVFSINYLLKAEHTINKKTNDVQCQD